MEIVVHTMAEFQEAMRIVAPGDTILLRRDDPSWTKVEKGPSR